MSGYSRLFMNNNKNVYYSQDYDKLKNDEVEKEKRFKDLSALSDKREQAKQDLKGIYD